MDINSITPEKVKDDKDMSAMRGKKSEEAFS